MLPGIVGDIVDVNGAVLVHGRLKVTPCQVSKERGQAIIDQDRSYCSGQAIVDQDRSYCSGQAIIDQDRSYCSGQAIIVQDRPHLSTTCAKMTCPLPQAPAN